MLYELAMRDASGAARAEILVPASYVLPLLDLVARWGVTERELLAGFGLDRESLAQPARRIPGHTYQNIVELARRLTREDGLAVFMGFQLRLSAHGFLGFAAQSAPNLRIALQLADRYARTRIVGLRLETEVHGEHAHLTLAEDASLGPLREFVVTALFASLPHQAKTLTGRDISGHAEVTFAEPKHYQRLRAQLPGPTLFEQPVNRLVFPADALDYPVVSADPAAYELVRQQCERDLEQLGEHSRSVHRVRKLLPRDGDGFRSLDDVAAAMQLSPRTLKRLLASHDTSFSEIVDGERRERAFRRLRESEVTIAAIAQELGYADVAGFSRAFRRWTGLSPGRFRRQRSI